MEHVDLLICGAGPVGCTVANRAARVLGWNVLIVDRRRHLAGNCFDENHRSGVLIHRYGPHYFRTNSKALVDFLSDYTEWVPGNYYVKSFVGGRLYPFPINLCTLSQYFKRPFTADDARAYFADVCEKIPNPANSEEQMLATIGRELYEAFFKGYTLKQWDRHPRDLDASVCARIPIRLNDDCRYVDHEYQLTPRAGFTAMFKNMIDHPNIRVMLDADFQEIRKAIHPTKVTLYTGPIDEYFGYRLGKLPWRSLHFEFVFQAQRFWQQCVQVNYPNDFNFTRTVEIKHVTRQQCPNTVVSYEYPRATGEPFYPVPSAESRKLFQAYRELAAEEERTRSVFFAGRLANYTYINTDQAIEMGFETFERIRSRADAP